MADFALWATAGEPALGFSNGAFMEAYETNRNQANELALEASLLVPPIRNFLTLRSQWSGTATDLLSELGDRVPEATKKQRGWPKNAKALSDRLRRLAPNLRRSGINMSWDKGADRNRTRTICLERVPILRPLRPHRPTSPLTSFSHRTHWTHQTQESVPFLMNLRR